MTDRTYDLVLYGATGFTGQLVAKQIAEHAPDDLRWAVAGRRKDALQSVVADIGLPDLPIVVADAHDEQSVADLAASTKVVCTTVGPYAIHGSALVAACATAGTDYCDLTGELHWMRRMIDAHQDTAAQSGARILHACGFDSIPFDLGVVYTQQQIHALHGSFATSVSGRVKSFKGGASGGTIASGVNMLGEAAKDPEVRRVTGDPYAINPEGERSGPDGGDRLTPFRDEKFDAWAAPFIMSVVNTRVVRRTHALLGYPWGRDFAYDEAMLTGSSPLGAVMAGGIGLGMAGAGLLGLASTVAPLRKVLDRVLPDPGTGPSPEAQEKGFYDVRFHATTAAGDSIMTRVKGKGDPGYGSTSKLLAQTALALAAGEAQVDGGFWTPGAALSDSLLRRLPEDAGLTFEVI